MSDETSGVQTLANTGLREYEDVYDISRYTTDELFGIIEIPPTNTMATIEAQVEKIVSALDEVSDAELQFYDDLEDKLRNEISAGKDMANVDPEKDGMSDDVLYDQSNPRDDDQDFNQYLANSKKRHDMIRPKTVQKIVNIDTKFRNNYYSTKSTDFTIVLPYKITDVISTRLAAYEIPCTYHTISSALKNNTFWLTGLVRKRQTHDDGKPIPSVRPEGYKMEDMGLVDHVFKITIPDGNYFAWYADKRPGLVLQNTINLAIQSAIKDAYAKIILENTETDPSGEPAPTQASVYNNINNLQLYYTCNRGSGKSAFVGNSTDAQGTPFVWKITEYKIIFTEISDDFTVTEIGMELPNTLGWILGFRLPEYTATPLSSDRRDLGIDIAYGTDEVVVLSEGLCDLRGPKYAYIGVEDFNNNSHEHYLGAFNSGNMKSDVLARISTSTFENVLDAGIQANVSDDMSTTINNTRYYHGPVDIQQLKISLYDEFGRIMDLNEMDWSMALSFDQLHDAGRLI